MEATIASTRLRWPSGVGLALVLLFATLASLHDPRHIDVYAPVGPAPSLYAAPRVIKRLHADWLAHPGPHSKDTYAEAAGSLFGLLCDNATDHELDQCIQFVRQGRVRSGIVGDGYKPDFPLDDVVLDALIARHDRSRVLAFLTNIPMDRVLFNYPEAALAATPEWDAINDDFVVLFDAFRQARTQAARDSLHRCIWRAFGDQPGPSNGDPDTYVGQCENWFILHRPDIRISEGADHPLRADLDDLKPGTPVRRPERFLLTLRSTRSQSP
jgi:hypothetical protein